MTRIKITHKHCHICPVPQLTLGSPRSRHQDKDLSVYFGGINTIPGNTGREQASDTGTGRHPIHHASLDVTTGRLLSSRERAREIVQWLRELLSLSHNLFQEVQHFLLTSTSTRHILDAQSDLPTKYLSTSK